jgi:hypothetical protein
MAQQPIRKHDRPHTITRANLTLTIITPKARIPFSGTRMPTYLPPRWQVRNKLSRKTEVPCIIEESQRCPTRQRILRVEIPLTLNEESCTPKRNPYTRTPTNKLKCACHTPSQSKTKATPSNRTTTGTNSSGNGIFTVHRDMIGVQ